MAATWREAFDHNYEAALSLAKRLYEAGEVQGALIYAGCCLQDGKHEEGLEILSQVSETNADKHCILASYESDKDRPGRAEEHLLQAAELSSSNEWVEGALQDLYNGLRVPLWCSWCHWHAPLLANAEPESTEPDTELFSPPEEQSQQAAAAVQQQMPQGAMALAATEPAPPPSPEPAQPPAPAAEKPAHQAAAPASAHTREPSEQAPSEPAPSEPALCCGAERP